jgi:hypothetical protein
MTRCVIYFLLFLLMGCFFKAWSSQWCGQILIHMGTYVTHSLVQVYDQLMFSFLFSACAGSIPQTCFWHHLSFAVFCPHAFLTRIFQLMTSGNYITELFWKYSSVHPRSFLLSFQTWHMNFSYVDSFYFVTPLYLHNILPEFVPSISVEWASWYTTGGSSPDWEASCLI